jgi:repressor of nif and glnA expression
MTNNKLGKFQFINGTVVAIAPDEVLEQEIESTEEGQQSLTNNYEDWAEEVSSKIEGNNNLVVESSSGSVIVNSEQVSEDDLQYVFDEHTEEISRRLSEKIRQENQARAAKVAVKTTATAVKTSVVTNPSSYDDIDLDFLDSLDRIEK